MNSYGKTYGAMMTKFMKPNKNMVRPALKVLNKISVRRPLGHTYVNNLSKLGL